MTNRTILGLALVAMPLAALFMPVVGRGVVAAMTLHELTTSSDVIVLGIVVDLNPVADDMVATAQVSEAWKGSVGPTIKFHARRTWPCDITHANVGETAILFLTRRDSTDPMTLANWGRGRLVVKTIDEVPYVGDRYRTLKVMDEMPIKWQFGTSDIPEPWAKVEDVKAYVKRTLAP